MTIPSQSGENLTWLTYKKQRKGMWRQGRETCLDAPGAAQDGVPASHFAICYVMGYHMTQSDNFETIMLS